jgi:hypothetical protein
MRTEFVETPKRSDAIKLAPWASRFIKVDHGYMCFESESDYQTWKGQK